MTDLKQRIREAIGDEPVAAFARRCGFGESLLRKYLAGAEPSASNLAKIAQAAGVSLEWMATGRGPKYRLQAPDPPVEVQMARALSALTGQRARRWERLIAIVEGIPDEDQREALLDELLARAQKDKEIIDLRLALQELKELKGKINALLAER